MLGIPLVQVFGICLMLAGAAAMALAEGRWITSGYGGTAAIATDKSRACLLLEMPLSIRLAPALTDLNSSPNRGVFPPVFLGHEFTSSVQNR